MVMIDIITLWTYFAPKMIENRNAVIAVDTRKAKLGSVTIFSAAVVAAAEATTANKQDKRPVFAALKTRAEIITGTIVKQMSKTKIIFTSL